MAKIKLTKNEQKKQKDSLKQFTRYLPTLQVKQKEAVEGMKSWIAVYGENSSWSEERSISHLVKVKEVKKTKGNIAGVEVPVFQSLVFEDVPYDLRVYPLWVDKAIVALGEIARYDALIETLKERIRLLDKELRTTTQRVNLFEKVKIPEAKENIRKIGIYLQDQQTSAVVRGKIAKKKLGKVS